MLELGKRIQETRAQQGINLKELAKKAGLSEQAMIAIEKGRVANPGFFTIAAIADALNISLDFLHKGIKGLTEKDIEILKKNEPALKGLNEALALLLSKLPQSAQ